MNRRSFAKLLGKAVIGFAVATQLPSQARIEIEPTEQAERGQGLSHLVANSGTYQAKSSGRAWDGNRPCENCDFCDVTNSGVPFKMCPYEPFKRCEVGKYEQTKA